MHGAMQLLHLTQIAMAERWEHMLVELAQHMLVMLSAFTVPCSIIVQGFTWLLSINVTYACPI